MSRRPPRRQSLNTSLTIASNSILEDEPQRYSEFVKQFKSTNLEVDSKYKLIKSNPCLHKLRDQLDRLTQRESDFQIILVTGPSGSGKSKAIRGLANEFKSKLSYFHLNATWILRREFGDPSKRLESLFSEATAATASLIFIDKLDRLNGERRILDVLEEWFDYLDELCPRVIVIATTNDPESIDSKFRLNFDIEIKFTLPKKDERAEALQNLVAMNGGTLTPKELDEIASKTDYYSLRDIKLLTKQAKRQNLEMDSFRDIMRSFKPALVECVVTPYAPLRWDDIGGIEATKEKLKKLVIRPIVEREKVRKLGRKPNKGAILYGPPGCGKTLLARALATESGFNFICVQGPEILSKYVGDSEAKVRKLYRQARELAPCIIFFDEFDVLAPTKDDDKSSKVASNVMTSILVQLDGVDPLENVFTLAATNRLDKIDPAMLRGRRLNPSIYIPLPSLDERIAIFDVEFRKMPLNLIEPREDVIGNIARKSQGFSGGDITEVCQVAMDRALDEDLEEVESRHLDAALEEVKQCRPPSKKQSRERGLASRMKKLNLNSKLTRR